MEKRFLDRRLDLMQQEGIVFRAGVNVGVDLPVAQMRSEFDAVLLAGGATWPRDLPVPGRELKGIHFAMDYLTRQNRICEGDPVPGDEGMTAEGRHVIIIGGGDTGADCLGTAHRQGALSVHQLELLSRPPDHRATGNPWPQWPNVFRVSTAHEEGGERLYSIATQRFSGDENGHVTTLHAVRVEKANGSFTPVPGSDLELKADLVLLAMGFLGPERGGLLQDLGVRLTDRGNVWRDEHWMTSVPGVFTAGDMQRGQSLIVWAIAEGRSAACGIDLFLMGHSALPAPLQ
jgi:glutamate synthase (NADPH/NADH) small chain